MFKVRKHFSKFVHPDKQDGGAGEATGHTSDGEIWLDFEGSPIQWHIPVGVLYDQFCILNNDNNEDLSLAPYSSLLPWNLTVHFSKFPELEILHCESRLVNRNGIIPHDSKYALVEISISLNRTLYRLPEYLYIWV